MKRDAKNRRSRGEADPMDLWNTRTCLETELVDLLQSDDPVKRTCAAIHLRKFCNDNVVSRLCDKLKTETKLYTKIALCESLVRFSERSIDSLILLLGHIGNNQESVIPTSGFYKTSYPLPRDLAARTLCRIGKDVLRPLERYLLESDNVKSVCQGLDAYGHIIYTNKIKKTSSVLQGLCEKYPDNKLVYYKIIRCLSGICDDWAQVFLIRMLESGNDGLRLEALRR